MKTQTLAPVQLAEFSTSKPMVEHDGYAALYNTEIDRGFYMMELAPKCFGESLDDPSSILILNQHNSRDPIGKAAKFSEESDGLHMDFLINTEVQSGKEVDSNIRQGVLTGLSVGFDIVKVEMEKRGGEGARGYEVDRITEAKLSEVSVVSFPAIEGARINASVSNPTLTTFAVNDGDAPRKHLQAGDRVMLATYAVTITPPRVRPNPPEETESLDEVKIKVEVEDESVDDSKAKDALDDSTASNDETDADPQPVELTEDEKYPGAREALERIIGGK